MRTVALGAALSLLALPAAAQPPPIGSVASIAAPSIVCDTSAQLQSIVEAFEQSLKAGEAKYLALFGQKNARSEPTCAIVPINIALTVESKSLGRLALADGDVYAWIVHIANDAGEAYYLYLEPPAKALRNTI
jgi:hypothetical protein